MRRLFELMFVALFVVGLAISYQSYAAWSTFKPPVTNNFTEHYYQELRGHKMVSADAGTASLGATTTVTGMEVGDVIIDVLNTEAGGGTITNLDEGIFTAAAGGATYNTSGGAATAGDNLLFLFVDIDNTN